MRTPNSFIRSAALVRVLIAVLFAVALIGCQQSGPLESPLGDAGKPLRPGAFREPVVAVQTVTDTGGGVSARSDTYIDTHGNLITRKATCTIPADASAGLLRMKERSVHSVFR